MGSAHTSPSPSACPFPVTTDTKRAHPGAEQPAAVLEGGGCGATRLHPGALQEDPVGVPQRHLRAPEQDRNGFQGTRGRCCLSTWLMSVSKFARKHLG